MEFRGLLFDFISSSFFDYFIMACIICNILTMAMAFEGSTVEYDSTLESVNLFFTIVFIIELILKLDSKHGLIINWRIKKNC